MNSRETIERLRDDLEQIQSSIDKLIRRMKLFESIMNVSRETIEEFDWRTVHALENMDWCMTGIRWNYCEELEVHLRRIKLGIPLAKFYDD